MAQRIDIVRRNGRVELVPQVLVVPQGEVVFWRNLDPDAEHHINLTRRLLKRYTGEPASSSTDIKVSGNLVYSCNTHPDDPNEKGTINVEGTV